MINTLITHFYSYMASDMAKDKSDSGRCTTEKSDFSPDTVGVVCFCLFFLFFINVLECLKIYY